MRRTASNSHGPLEGGGVLFESMVTHRVGWLLIGRVGCLVRADYFAFLGEDGEDFDFLAALLHKPI